MRVVFLGNNRVAFEILKCLKRRKEELVALVIHPSERATFVQEMVEVAALPPERIFDGSRVRSPEILDKISRLQPEIGLSVYFSYILEPEFLRIFSNGCINVHPAYLPFNRGAHSNVWSIIDDTRAGVTIHKIDKGVDTGPVLFQREIPKYVTDTGKSLYRRLEDACINLFEDSWEMIRRGDLQPRQQPHKGTSHRIKELGTVDEINMQQSYRAQDLIDLLRARTFPPHPGAYFVHEGRKIYLRLQIVTEEELQRETIE